MPRVDIWDVQAAQQQPAVDCGFGRDLEAHYEWGAVLGKGGFGLVRVVTERATGAQFACKSVSKTLDIPNLSPQKQAQHLDNVKREIRILTRLRGTLSVVHFKGAYEDDHSIHLVMELCRGGELVHEIGRRPYTEKTVAGYMRSVLHTLAQCHSHRILHRDVKPGNFMLLTQEDDSPLKAIDFGLAVFFDPEKLPRTDLGLEGTPWFMAPETLSSQTYPASDVWAAGVMAYQLLSGYLPFDDVRNPTAPALSVIWKGILGEEPSFRRSAWKEVSEEAKDFVRTLLNKDHAARPSAKEALRHPWLSPAFHQARARPISSTVVQRIQRFAQGNLLRRTILELIAQELLKMAPALSPTVHGPGEVGAYLAAQQGQRAQQPSSDGSEPSSSPLAGGGAAPADTLFAMSPDSGEGATRGFAAMIGSPGALGSSELGPRSASINIAELARPRPRPSIDSSAGGSSHGGESFGRGGLLARVAAYGRGAGSVHGGRLFARSPSTQQLALLARGSERQRGSATVHGPGDYWRVMRQASELAAMESGHGRTHYLRAAPRTEEERLAARKAARLSLDTSAHGGDEYRRMLRQLETRELRHKVAGRHAKSTGSLPLADDQAGTSLAAAAAEPLPQPQQQPGGGAQGWPDLGAGAAAAAAPPPAGATPAGEAGVAAVAEERGRGRGAAKALLERLSADPSAAEGGLHPVDEAAAPSGQPLGGQLPTEAAAPGAPGPRSGKRVSFGVEEAAPGPAAPMALDPPPPAPQPQQQQQQQQTLASLTAAGAVGGGGGHFGAVTDPRDLEQLMRRMHFRSNKGLGPEEMSEGLRRLGYDLEPSEAAALMQQLDLDADGQVAAPEFVASQLDWAALQESHRELWLECARRAFEGLAADADGRLRVEALIGALRGKLPAAEVDYAVEDALVEAGYADADEVDFEGFLRMLRVGSYDSLDALDQYDSRYGDSLHGRRSVEGEASQLAGHLDPVPEEATPRAAP